MNEIKTQDELNQLTKVLAELDMSKLDYQDQLYLSQAHLEFMNKIKPILVKNIDKLPENERYIIRL